MVFKHGLRRCVMNFMKRILPSLVAGTALGSVFYVVGGAGAAFVPGVTAPVYAAIGFLCAVSVGIAKALQEDEEAEKAAKK